MSSDLRHAVLQLVKSPGYRPVKPAVIAKRRDPPWRQQDLHTKYNIAII